ncbi:MAG: hypothetical protein ACXABZ_03550 [Candidatus Thorarchaeota archaeon]
MEEVLTKEVRNKILDRITPSLDEIHQQERLVEILRKALEMRAENLGILYSFIEAQGSTGKKQTQLHGAADIDIFVGLRPEDYESILSLPLKERDKRISSTLDRFVDEWFSTIELSGITSRQKTYSQHPYLSLRINDTDVDILCCFDLSAEVIQQEGPVTAVDRTLHHTRYVSQHLTKKTREVVRLLKSFVRASHAYGDMCAVGRMGFTGYALELLAINYNTLENALDAIRNLDSCALDPLNRPLEELRKIPTFRNDYIFIIDPTDTGRNVASSFSKRAFKWIKIRIEDLLSPLAQKNDNRILKLMLESPIPTGSTSSWFNSRAKAFEFESDNSVHYTELRDKLYRFTGKLVKSLESERTGEKRFGRILSEVYFEAEKFAVGLVVEYPTIEKTYSRRGPLVELKDAAENFTIAHSKAYEKEGYLWVDEKRQWTSAWSFAKHIVDDHQIDGLRRAKARSVVSDRVLSVLFRYVLPTEPDFPRKEARV